MAALLDILFDSTGRSLVDTGRFEEIVQGMSHPDSQYPSLVYFAGNGNRIKALQALFPRNNITRKGPSGLLRAHLSTATAHTEYPVIFTESNPFSHAGLSDTRLLRWSEDRHRRYALNVGESQSLAELQQEVITQKILPWTQVLCFFVDTISEMRNVQQLLDAPIGTLSIGASHIHSMMRVLIVLSGNSQFEVQSPDDDFELSNAWLAQRKVTILDLRDRAEMSPSVTFDPLRSLIFDEIQEIRALQKEKCLLFSAVHLNALWDRGLQLQIGSPSPANLDCLLVAREGFKRKTTNIDCLLELKTQVASSVSSENELYSFIASALLLDAYPPGMHLFEPKLVFNALYRARCWNAWEGENPSFICDQILHCFIKSFSELMSKTSAEIRHESLVQFHRGWGGLHSTTTCFICMCGPPEHMLPCRHAICDNCVVIYGSKSSYAEYHINLPECPICEEAVNLTIRQLPPTKGPIVISLDGGGIRGIIQLGLLRALEKRIGGISITQVADLFAGTSVGALSELDMVLNGLSAKESCAKFPAIAHRIFGSPTKHAPNSQLYRCATWIKNIAGILADCQYDSKILGDILQKVVDPQRRLFDATTTTSSTGCRVAIITSRTSDGKACVLANYRGMGQREVNAAYHFLIPKTADENPHICQLGRWWLMTSSLFRKKTLLGFGSLQDGGVRANNPVGIALKESMVIWPSAKTHDLLLSVGTGSYSSMAKTSEATRGIWQDSAIPRMIRATMSSPCMDGEQGFREALNFVPDGERSNIFRLNHELTEPLPRLDDVSRLEEMSRMQYTVPTELVRATLATAFFFFELDELPTKRQGEFFCEGSILCSRSYSRDLVKLIMVEFPGARFETVRGHHLGNVDQNDGCHVCGYYRKKVTFSINGLHEMTSIGIAGCSFFQKIGGFPKSMQELLDDQQANSRFGRLDHLVASWPPKRDCYCSPRLKRQIKFLEPAVIHKKRRL
ncbi:uncharacterized protein N7511_000851 [Penicillium nucicola]|uniref:uncharacterized protein n=1 Tax=Penicillium nucicola TaxID=1850975 RepID=UPI002545164F|nr:uncharacterized protein N7511_000851 [Penicillium nucicola]KAJ5775840.1 hypothetical protein N7511_000851 [Penicillium nucicola]